MTDTTKWKEKVLDNLVGFDPMTNKHHCKLCGNLYKHQARFRRKIRRTVKNHIEKEHPERVQMELDRMSSESSPSSKSSSSSSSSSEEHNMNMISFYHKMLFTQTDREIKRVDKAIAKAKKELDDNFEYAFSWVMEDLLINIETKQMLKLVKKTIEHFDNLDDIHHELKAFKVAWTRNVLNNFPHHNSTSEFTNIHERLKTTARAKFVDDKYGGGHLETMIRYSKDLIELVNKTIPIITWNIGKN